MIVIVFASNDIQSKASSINALVLNHKGDSCKIVKNFIGETSYEDIVYLGARS